MATTTPNFGWAVPTSSDLVKNGAVAIETLGDAIDASLVDLKGGTTGQVLSKASGTDMDFTWATPAGGATYVGAAVYIHNTSVSYTENTEVLMTPTTSDYNTDSIWNSGSNPSRLTIPSGKGGKYQITISHRFAVGVNYVQVYLYKNGSRFNTTGLEGGIFTKSNDGGNSTGTNGTVTVSAAAGDYFQIYLQSNVTTGSQTTWYRCQIDYLGA